MAGMCRGVLGHGQLAYFTQSCWLRSTKNTNYVDNPSNHGTNPAKDRPSNRFFCFVHVIGVFVGLSVCVVRLASSGSTVRGDVVVINECGIVQQCGRTARGTAVVQVRYDFSFSVFGPSVPPNGTELSSSLVQCTPRAHADDAV
ncbi:hypothetical protein GEV33_006154 [Tenebrio molitor]|uniref:Uncharacterized protein n=1 Tax=Tenebrio molitor TaxID=7067 RepID=A0A8J6LE53_TENMO|nr:hypothetical protein GEV33_006154 [Tenebrio molitor]